MLDHGRMIIDASPIEAVRRLRDLYVDEEELRGSAPEHPEGRSAELLAVRVLDGSGAPGRRFAPGDGLVVEVDVRALEPVSEWVVGFELVNHGEVVVYGSNSHLLAQELPDLSGDATVRFVVPSLPVAEGQYFITAAVHPRVGPEWDRIVRGAHFKVLSQATQAGVVHLEPQVRLVPRDETRSAVAD
jgi:ABC-2 type transport system ATP-binding protein